MSPVCVVPGCDKPRKKSKHKKWLCHSRHCSMHAERMRLTGEPGPVGTVRIPKRYKKIGGERAHRVVWKRHFGPIPEGYHVHHIDENGLNNDISNLVALPESEHHALHGRRIWA